MADDPKPPPAFEETPLTRPEYVAALVHFYRGEIYRATQWRLRLDTTTNWSILSAMGLVTFSLGEPSHPHAAIVLGMAMVHTFLVIEARRYRFFDMWQTRVRLLEKNFYGPIVRRDLHSPLADWGAHIADDLLHPRFRLTKRQALRSRLRRNYWPLFGILLAAWVLKLGLHPQDPAAAWWQRAALGDFPAWLLPAAVGLEYGWLLMVAWPPLESRPDDDGLTLD